MWANLAGTARDIIKVIQGERTTLAALNHQNVVKCYTFGEVSITIKGELYEFPYIIMEYLPGVKDLREYLKDAEQIPATKTIEIIHDVLAGLAYLHEVGIYHCDIKPDNILIAPNRPALITDFGYSKHMPLHGGRQDGMTDMVFTLKYAHPELKDRISNWSDPNATIAQLPREQLRPSYDLYALGRTFLEMLRILNGKSEAKDAPRMTEYETVYVSLLAKRLLDGRVDQVEDNEILADAIPHLPEQVMAEIRYSAAYDALRDIEKLLRLHDLEGEIPELRPELPDYTQVPHCHVPMTRRVRAVVNHPTFYRLSRVSQLGFVSLVYPGATHTRLEHALGVFAHCCRYVRALWYDERNCLVRALFTPHQLEVALVAALLHDVAQFPMAHDLSEVSGLFAHERFTTALLEAEGSDGGPSLAATLLKEWGVSAAEVLDVLGAGSTGSLRNRILHAIVSGPLDCDKIDYLKRDSTHLGVAFGASIDEERLIRNITIGYKRSSERVRAKNGDEVFTVENVGIGVTEKALGVADAIWRARRLMFAQVYWHHTVRALKAMLGYAVRRLLLQRGDDREFWTRFHEEIVWLRAPMEISAPTDRVGPDTPAIRDAILPSEEFESLDSWNEPGSQLAGMDDAVLLFLRRYCDERGRIMIDSVRQRQVFARHTVISRDQYRELYDQVYDRLRELRFNNDVEGIEAVREGWETTVREQCLQYLNQHPDDAAGQALVNAVPLLLVDVPIRANARGGRGQPLLFLPEASQKERASKRAAFPRFQVRDTQIEDKEFDKSTGKIRVFVPPALRELVALAVSPDEVRRIMAGR